MGERYGYRLTKRGATFDLIYRDVLLLGSRKLDVYEIVRGNIPASEVEAVLDHKESAPTEAEALVRNQ